MALVKKTLDADVANGAIIVVDYKEGVSMPKTTGTYVSVNNNRYDQDDGEIGVVLGDTSATITNNTGLTWLDGHVVSVEFSEIEKKNSIYITQAAYDAIVTKDPDTEYNIVEA